MKKFSFKLQAVLREREIREDERKRELAETIKEWLKQKQILDRLQNYLKESEALSYAEKEKKVPDIKTIRSYEMFMMMLRRRIIEQKIETKKAEKCVDDYRIKLAEAMKRKKILFTFRDKLHKIYQSEAEKLERKELDEISVLRVNHAKHH
ncbi:MAG: flagellar export protein FliJ [Candidatus Aureabacteria bacterium]|nr:flagellar export protein FliJ [Candidatus Auribacterota bacterium]